VVCACVLHSLTQLFVVPRILGDASCQLITGWNTHVGVIRVSMIGYLAHQRGPQPYSGPGECIPIPLNPTRAGSYKEVSVRHSVGDDPPGLSRAPPISSHSLHTPVTRSHTVPWRVPICYNHCCSTCCRNWSLRRSTAGSLMEAERRLAFEIWSSTQR
jgi:hypothetical protein